MAPSPQIFVILRVLAEGRGSLYVLSMSVREVLMGENEEEKERDRDVIGDHKIRKTE